MFNTVTWLFWLVAALMSQSITRNPLYLALSLLWLGVLWRCGQMQGNTAPMPFSPWRFGAIVVGLSTIFNALMVHVGTTELFRLPAGWLLVGGAITLEAAIYGALNGLALSGLFLAFSILNQMLPVSALVRVIPRAFYPIAVVISIAITFIPTTLRQFRQIREAQAVRGHQPHGVRDWLPLFLPLLIGGLERAVNLAEAMTARGFAAADAPAQPALTRLLLIAGLLLALVGWALQLLWSAVWGTAILVLGIGLLAGTLYLAGRRIPHTTYRRQRWVWRDTLTVMAALVVITTLVAPIPGIEHRSLAYYPYPALTAPEFDPLIALATTGLLAPIFWLKRKNTVSSSNDGVRMTNDFD